MLHPLPPAKERQTIRAIARSQHRDTPTLTVLKLPSFCSLAQW
jgi:hypothetical protein